MDRGKPQVSRTALTVPGENLGHVEEIEIMFQNPVGGKSGHAAGFMNERKVRAGCVRVFYTTVFELILMLFYGSSRYNGSSDFVG